MMQPCFNFRDDNTLHDVDDLAHAQKNRRTGHLFSPWLRQRVLEAGLVQGMDPDLLSEGLLDEVICR